MKLHRHRLIRIAQLLAIVAPIIWALMPSRTVTDLDQPPKIAWFKKTPDLEKSLLGFDAKSNGGFALGDVDGNGTQDMVTLISNGILSHPPTPPGTKRFCFPEVHLPGALLDSSAQARLLLRSCADVDGDGHEEALVTVRRSTTDPWHLCIIDAALGRIEHIYALRRVRNGRRMVIGTASTMHWESCRVPMGPASYCSPRLATTANRGASWFSIRRQVANAGTIPSAPIPSWTPSGWVI